MKKIIGKPSEYLHILFGNLLYALGFNLFLNGNNIAAGGFGGIGLVVSRFLPVSVGTVVVVLSIPIFIWSYKVQGAKYTISAFLSTLAFSGFTDLFSFLPNVTDNKLLAALCGEETPRVREEKEALLVRHRIALYDVIESCSIVGSSDSSIDDVVVTDLAPLLANSRIGTNIFTNGATAYRLFMKYTYPLLGIPAVKLPSTSPANAAFSLGRLTEEWLKLLPPLTAE